MNISVVIPTRNQDLPLLKKAIQSVLWADDILIADSSKTKSGMIEVKNFTANIGTRYIHREYKYSANFKNWAIPQAKYEWVLLLDSDEIVTNKLKQYIGKVLQSKNIKSIDGFGIARKHFFFGKFLRHGGRYPLYNVRLFRKSCRYEDRNVHAHILIKKDRLVNIKPSNGDILHYSDRNYEQFFERFNRYSDYQAEYLLKRRGQRAKINWKEFFTNPLYFKAIVKDIWFFIPGAPVLRFLLMYVVKLGFLDGEAGLRIAILYSFQDYVSKTKYRLLQKKSIKWRQKFQNIFVYLIAVLFGNERREFITQFYKCLPVMKKIETIIQAEYI